MAPKNNPRTSIPKTALALKAVEYDDFEDFSSAYWDSCAKGLYWYPTNDGKFDIDSKIQALAKKGGFYVYCSPLQALSGDNDKLEYAAEIDASAVVRSKIEYDDATRTYGRVKITDLQDAFVVRVLNAYKAGRAWKYQLGLMPSSKDQLRKFWESAWAAKRIADEKLARKKGRRMRRIALHGEDGEARMNPGEQGPIRKIPSTVNIPGT